MTKIVVWDPGHGGKDPGGAGYNLQEKDVVLNIATQAAKLLEEQYEDVKSLMTRSTDVYVELKARTDYANNAKADVLVSIHCNAGGGNGGFESFIYNGNVSDAIIQFQQNLHKSIIQKLQANQVLDRGPKRANLHMCRESNMPAVLTENLFIDVAKDAALLKQPEIITAIVQGHVSGVAQFLGLKPKNTGGGSYNISTDVTLSVNEQPISDALIINGVSYAPVRSLGEALGASVNWDAANKHITLTKK
ncbi:hypothetical protein BVG16_05675 [Paenibacillus selenitireducens]|uniref:MurNAc-LAA domain-containing protein n=1 Tax=Paenibacillus selenitireducens TaxID=1324314 RepID=A0A1T2XKM4_9BACL|nr:N-acetylmuramoyl-L-alanine amidase [Paenibacillus selenitireducens]OPA80233.1 hypothetical protein BVG16_05675 [Paenibacillus selenitireducens]